MVHGLCKMVLLDMSYVICSYWWKRMVTNFCFTIFFVFWFCIFLENSFFSHLTGQNASLLISILVKHLEHKTILKQPDIQLNIVEVTACLAERSKAQASAAIIGPISDLVKHLRKSMHCAFGNKHMGDDIIKWNDNFRNALDECIIHLSKKVLLLLWFFFFWKENRRAKPYKVLSYRFIYNALFTIACLNVNTKIKHVFQLIYFFKTRSSKKVLKKEYILEWSFLWARIEKYDFLTKNYDIDVVSVNRLMMLGLFLTWWLLC